MPGAKTHDTIAVASGFVLAPISGAALFALGDTLHEAALDTAVLVGSHLVCSYWLSPDLDIDSRIDDRWGPLRPIWLPYQKLVPHRHWLSHSGISALLRVLYLLVSLGLVLWLVSLVLPGEVRQFVQGAFVWVRDHPRELVLILVGAVISDTVHTISDVISTRRKRRLRIKRVRRSKPVKRTSNRRGYRK